MFPDHRFIPESGLASQFLVVGIGCGQGGQNVAKSIPGKWNAPEKDAAWAQLSCLMDNAYSDQYSTKTLAENTNDAQVCAVESADATRLTAFASEAVLRRDWDASEEDAAWAHL